MITRTVECEDFGVCVRQHHDGMVSIFLSETTEKENIMKLGDDLMYLSREQARELMQVLKESVGE